MTGSGNRVDRTAPRSDRLARAATMVDEWVEGRLVPGVSLAIAYRGDLVLTHTAGKVSAGSGGPVTPDTRYSVASLTKPVTAAAALALVERGDLYLDEPVRRWLPEFATATSDAARRQITARELLCHVAGLPKSDPAITDLLAREAPFDTLVEAAASVPLDRPPGQRVSYSNVAYWILGGLVAAAAGSGTDFVEVTTDLILRPAGLPGTTFRPGSDDPDIARVYGPNRIPNSPYGRQLGSPAGGLFATAGDMARLAGAFAAGAGYRGGAAGISRASVHLMTTDQTEPASFSPPAPNPIPPRSEPRRPGPLPGGIEGMRDWDQCPWAFGWEVRGDKTDHWTGDLVSPATISHLGQSGCLAWADPVSGLSMAVLANRDLGSGWATGGRPENSPGAVDSPARWARLSDVVASAV